MKLTKSSNAICVNFLFYSLNRYDSELWRSVNLDNCRFKKEGILGSLLHRGIVVLRLSKAEVCFC